MYLFVSVFYLFMCVCVHMCWMCVTAHLKWSEYNLLKSIHYFHRVNIKDLSWVVRLDSNPFCMQS